MEIDIDNLSTDQAAQLLADLTNRAREQSVEQRAGEEIDRTLHASLAERGVGVGAQWEDPRGRASRAYPKRWIAQHAGHWWRATEHAVLTEPGVDKDAWVLNDPEPTSEQGATDAG